MQTGLDHIILGVNDLDCGIAWVEENTGVRPVFGGVHPGRGTRNALLALGPECYLEVIAPDPQQAFPSWFTQVSSMPDPRLIAWAVHTPDLTSLAQAAVRAGIPIDGPHEGKRSRQDGEILRWRLFHLQNDCAGLLPFFIEWSRESLHPAADAPSGCRLEAFHLQSPQPTELTRICQALDVVLPIERGELPGMFARISSPKRQLALTS